MRKQKGKYRAGIYLLAIFSLMFGVGPPTADPSFGGRNPEGQISVSSLIPDSLIQSTLGEKNCPPWADFKESLRQLGFDFNESRGDFDLPSLTFVVSLEKPVKAQIIEREWTIPIKCPRAENNYPAIIEKEKGSAEGPPKADGLFQEHWLITDTSFLAKEKVGKLKVYPFTVDPNSNYLLYQPYRFEFSLPEALGASSQDEKGQKAIRQEDPERNFFSRFPIWFKIKIDSTGLYKITGKELKRAGLNLSSVLPEGFKLYNIGEFLPPVSYPDTMVEIPIYVYTGQDGRFDPDDYILFYGEGVSRWDEKRKNYFQDIFSLYNYYWLTYSSEPGKRIPITSPSQSGQRLPLLSRVHIEKELLCPPRGGTLWLWDMISLQRGETKTSKSFSFSFPEAETLIGLTFRVFSAERNWTIRTFANGFFLDSTFIFSAQTPGGQTISIETSLPLVDDRCIITLEVSAGGDRDIDAFIDWFEFHLLLRREISRPVEVFCPNRADYVFLAKEDFFLLDVSDHLSPKFLNLLRRGDSIFFSPARESTVVALSPISQVRSVLAIEERNDLSLSPLPSLSADFLIVAPKEFRRLANLFTDYRRKSSDLSVGYALLEDIYDIYLFGIEEPYALKRFFQRKQPRYALLLGDGTYDYRGLLVSKKPGIPPYEYGTGFSYEVYERYPLALDCWYADFDDSPYPLYPDFVLGRIPCRSEKEGMDYLAKIKEYEINPLKDYSLRFLFSADDEYLGDPYTPDNCGLGVHIRSCEYLERFLPNFFEVKKVYLTEYPLSSVKDKPLARKQFSDEIGDGVLGVIYFGHGAGFRLAHEQLLNIEDVFKVKGNKQYPFGFFGSCGVGRFDDFELGRYREAIAEDLIRNPDGFIATIACTKASSPGTNERLCEVLLSSLFSSASGGLGEAFFRAQVHDISYHLFGDPLIKIALPVKADWRILSKDTLQPKKVNTFSCSLPSVKERVFSSRIFYGKRLRKYTSTVYYNNVPYIFRMDYTLPGYRVGLQKNRQASSLFQINFIPPAGIPLDTVGDINNFYWEMPNTAKIISFISERDASSPRGEAMGYAFLWDSIVRDTTPGELTDTEGPLIYLLSEGRVLRDTAYLPKTFLLSGELIDQSGIFTSSYRFYPRLFLNEVEIDLSTYLKEDYQLAHLRFDLPISLSSETTMLRVISYDNFLNFGERRVKITTSLSPRLFLSMPLAFYQKGNISFTFTLSYPALVEFKVWTISGRFIKSFSSICPSGQNTATFPLTLPKGVYLYKLAAYSFSLNQKAEVYEKLLVH